MEFYQQIWLTWMMSLRKTRVFAAVFIRFHIYVLFVFTVDLISFLNWPYHLYGYTPSDAQLSPLFSLAYSKVYVDMDSLFLFQLCLRDLFGKNEDAPCCTQPFHVKGALALGQFQSERSFHIQDRTGRKWWSAFRSLKIGSKFRITKILRSESSVIVWKRSRELKLSQRESTFSVNRSRVTWRVFIFDEQIAKIKLN